MSTFSEKLRSMGFGFVCSNCAKLHRGFGKGINHCGYELGGKDCGGPLGRPPRAFPEYEGPLTKTSIADLCFVCGEQSENLIQIPNGRGFVGACKTHVEMVRPNSSKAMVPVEVPQGKTA